MNNTMIAENYKVRAEIICSYNVLLDVYATVDMASVNSCRVVSCRVGELFPDCIRNITRLSNLFLPETLIDKEGVKTPNSPPQQPLRLIGVDA